MSCQLDLVILSRGPDADLAQRLASLLRDFFGIGAYSFRDDIPFLGIWDKAATEPDYHEQAASRQIALNACCTHGVFVFSQPPDSASGKWLRQELQARMGSSGYSVWMGSGVEMLRSAREQHRSAGAPTSLGSHEQCKSIVGGSEAAADHLMALLISEPDRTVLESELGVDAEFRVACRLASLFTERPIAPVSIGVGREHRRYHEYCRWLDEQRRPPVYLAGFSGVRFEAYHEDRRPWYKPRIEAQTTLRDRIVQWTSETLDRHPHLINGLFDRTCDRSDAAQSQIPLAKRGIWIGHYDNLSKHGAAYSDLSVMKLFRHSLLVVTNPNDVAAVSALPRDYRDLFAQAVSRPLDYEDDEYRLSVGCFAIVVPKDLVAIHSAYRTMLTDVTWTKKDGRGNLTNEASAPPPTARLTDRPNGRLG